LGSALAAWCLSQVGGCGSGGGGGGVRGRGHVDFEVLAAAHWHTPLGEGH
jgi:hypothetical protein